MAKPLVAIVGRPNVGKSMLFNKLTGQRTSIVEDTPGVTRDRIYGDCEWCNRHFSLVDTGGIEPGTDSDMLKFMRRQAEIAIENANVVVFVCDIKTGMTASDQEVAGMLLRSQKPVVLAVNKMDLVQFDEKVFKAITEEYLELTSRLGIEDVTCFPLSALDGDNVVEKSQRTPWYEGPSLLDFLENVPIHLDRNMQDFRYPVQYVLRPNLDFRGFCAKIASGVVRKGDEIVALPSLKRSRVKSIVTYEGELQEAFCPQCVTLTLEDEIDISRGEMLVHPDNLPHIGRRFETMLVWMDEEPMNRGKQFFLKHNTNTTRATVDAVDFRVDVNTMEHLEGADLRLNEIASVRITTAKTLFFDSYAQNRATGNFVLIDPITNNTSAVGMIVRPIEDNDEAYDALPVLDLTKLGITAEQQQVVEKVVKELSRQGLEIKIIK